MANKLYRFGNADNASVTPKQQKANKKVDRDPVRLRTTIHFGASSAPRYRVLALLERGGEALLCMGINREEALSTARSMGNQLPEGTRLLCLQRWNGGLIQGRWKNERCERNELPLVPSRRRRRVS